MDTTTSSVTSTARIWWIKDKTTSLLSVSICRPVHQAVVNKEEHAEVKTIDSNNSLNQMLTKSMNSAQMKRQNLNME